MAKAEISWKRVTEEGVRLQVYAHHVGNRWIFYTRHQRHDQWEEVAQPVLEDWLCLLDAVRRSIPRRLQPPDEERRLRKAISERFPDADLDALDS
jgi:hypothetical protein